jgi:hypothetical protein
MTCALAGTGYRLWITIAACAQFLTYRCKLIPKFAPCSTPSNLGSNGLDEQAHHN